MTHDEMIAVIQAHKDGKSILFRVIDSNGNWMESNPSFDFSNYEYRIKPEPPKEWWFVKNIGEHERYGWSRHEVQQVGVDYLEQIHVREVLE